MKSQYIILPKDLKNKYVQNNNIYSKEELILFHDTVCVKISLTTISAILERFEYDHEKFKLFIAKNALGNDDWSEFNGISIKNITTGSKKYHTDLFDLMYIRKLDELPLLIHDDVDLKPVVFWRFQIGK